MLALSARDQNIIEHHGLVRTIAMRMVQRFPNHVDVEELINVGMLGLIDAVDRFDASRGVPFRAYAEIRIRGAIVDALRAADWIPRTVRRSAARLETTRVELRRRLGREPRPEEMADALGLPVEEYEDLCATSEIRSVVSLDLPTGDEGEGRIIDQVANEEPSVLDHWVGAEQRARVGEAIQALPDKERTVVTLYYLNGLSLKEIGAILHVTESRVSQLRAAGVKRLQTRLQDLDEV